MGFGMDRGTWNLIRNCSKVSEMNPPEREACVVWCSFFLIPLVQFFCTYDDYNWDWSLNQLGKACPLIRRDLKVLDMKSPRIFHIGTWLGTSPRI